MPGGNFEIHDKTMSSDLAEIIRLADYRGELAPILDAAGVPYGPLSQWDRSPVRVAYVLYNVSARDDDGRPVYRNIYSLLGEELRLLVEHGLVREDWTGRTERGDAALASLLMLLDDDGAGGKS